ncbi:MAG TPA: apolipoprotein N-acyltransferase [Pyrinomonadaceae bacterium]
MQEAVSLAVPWRVRLRHVFELTRAGAPTLAEASVAVLSAALLILSFPDFDLWPVAWVALAPLLLAVARNGKTGAAFVLGWVMGSLFFYGSCYWLTYSMIRYGHIPVVASYLLLLPAALAIGLFPAACAAALARAVSRLGASALFAAPFLWAALEWARLGVTGQLWNAVGYSQAYHPALIQSARWGGVYMVGFFVVLFNAAVAYALLRRSVKAALLSAAVILFVACVVGWSGSSAFAYEEKPSADAVVVAVQPNVPMEPTKSVAEDKALLGRHVSLSENALRTPGASTFAPRVVVWPESPMNFTYARDRELREFVAQFASRNRASVIFNSLEPAPLNGDYNAALMVNEEGRLVAQYDKIRLLPFGEYVPLPRWLPGANLVPTMVGDFTPGAEYALMPVGGARAGVFICFESAFPSIARAFSSGGADVLINISNDGYLGPTPVMRQHLANAVFRAVENERPVLRVTNTGITAHISGRGEVTDATGGFQTATRVWPVSRSAKRQTFYTRHGDLFAGACAVVSILILGLTIQGSRLRTESRKSD